MKSLAIIASIITLTTLASASSTEEHRALMVAGQMMRSDGKLIRAREVLADCERQVCDDGDPECATIQRYCGARAREVELELPAARIVVVDDLGAPLASATAEIGGRAAHSGDVVELDPGRYVLRATWLGRAGTTDVDLRPTQRDAIARVTIDLRTVVTARPVPWYVTALVTGAAVSTLAFGGFMIATVAQQSSFSSCQPACPWDQRQAYVASTVGTDIALGLALTTAVGALVTWLARPTVSRVEHLQPVSR